MKLYYSDSYSVCPGVKQTTADGTVTDSKFSDQRRSTPVAHTGAPLLLRAASGGDRARDRQRPPLPPREGRGSPRPQTRKYTMRASRQTLPGQDL